MALYALSAVNALQSLHRAQAALSDSPSCGDKLSSEATVWYSDGMIVMMRGGNAGTVLIPAARNSGERSVAQLAGATDGGREFVVRVSPELPA